MYSKDISLIHKTLQQGCPFRLLNVLWGKSTTKSAPTNQIKERDLQDKKQIRGLNIITPG